jgi:hypothetical protein
VPLAIGASEPAGAPALAPLVEKVAAQGGGAVAWRTVDSRAAAERMLDRKEVYGAVLFSPAPGGLAATVLLSGAVNPGATQAAQPVLEHVAEAVTRTVRVVTIHPTSVAGRVLPLAAGPCSGWRRSSPACWWLRSARGSTAVARWAGRRASSRR